MCRPTVFFFFVFVFETELNFTGPVCMCRVCYSILQGLFSKSRYRTNITYIPIVHRKTIYLDLLKWSTIQNGGSRHYYKIIHFKCPSIVSAGLLVPRSVIQWRPALGKDHPYENMGEIVACAPFLERGLGFPCSFFFSGLLRYYRIQLHYLTPNSFVHISIFVHLCEAFLGIEPHIELFRFLFHLKPQPDSNILDVVGGMGLQLRQRKVIDWKPKWFYVEN